MMPAIAPRAARICIALVVALAMTPAIANARPIEGDTAEGIPAGWSSGYVFANGIRIHYYRAVPAPGKPVMVMVHGVTDIGLSWTPLTWKLQDSYDIYMLDARGHGLSDPFTHTDDGDTMVKDVVEFVRAMSFEKPILVGHSMGAATVMRVGAEYPELASAIIMLDPGLRPRPAGAGGAPPGGLPAARTGAPPAAPPAPPPGEGTAPDRLSVSMVASPEVLVAQNNYPFEDLVATCHRQTPKWSDVGCRYWALSKKQYHGPYTPEAWQAMSGTMATGESLASIPVPALVLKADAASDVRRANEEAATVMQSGRLVHIDGGGHNLHHDETERTVEVLTEFLSGL
jgi:pimeloyl-ACP methyl ester carboxylesterase